MYTDMDAWEKETEKFLAKIGQVEVKQAKSTKKDEE